MKRLMILSLLFFLFISCNESKDNDDKNKFKQIKITEVPEIKGIRIDKNTKLSILSEKDIASLLKVKPNLKAHIGKEKSVLAIYNDLKNIKYKGKIRLAKFKDVRLVLSDFQVGSYNAYQSNEERCIFSACQYSPGSDSGFCGQMNISKAAAGGVCPASSCTPGAPNQCGSSPSDALCTISSCVNGTCRTRTVVNDTGTCPEENQCAGQCEEPDDDDDETICTYKSCNTTTEKCEFITTRLPPSECPESTCFMDNQCSGEAGGVFPDITRPIIDGNGGI